MTVVYRRHLKPAPLTPLERKSVDIVRRHGAGGMDPVALRAALGIRERSMWVLAARLLDRGALRLVDGQLQAPDRS